MPMTDSARVGLTVLVAAGALGGGYLWLTGSLHSPDTYTQRVSFDNAQGVQKGAPVRVQGVDMGRVEEIALGADQKPVMLLRVRGGADGYRIHPEDGIRIVGSLVGFTQPFIEITPGGRRAAVVQPGGVLPGESGTSQDQVLAQSDQLLHNMNELTTRLNTITAGFARVTKDGRLADDLAKTVHNFAKASDSGVVVARNMEQATGRVDRLISSFESTSGSLNATLKRADKLFVDLRGTAGESQALMRDARGVVKDTGELVRSSQGVVQHTDETIKNANGLVTDTRTFIALNRSQLQEVVNSLNSSLKKLDSTLTEAQGFLGDKRLQGDLKETAANVKEATENLKKITVDVRTLTGDPKVQEDLKVTVTNLRDATEQAAELFRRVRGVIGGGGKTAKTVAQKVADAQFKADVLRTVNSNRTRFDFDATIPWSQNTFYRAGIFDFGEANEFNIQAGRRLRSNVWARYGIHASKLGGGLDFGSPNHPYFSIDVFGVDQLRADLQGNIPVTPYLDLTLGVDKAFNNPDPVFGIRYHK